MAGSSMDWTSPPCSAPRCFCIRQHPRRVRGRCLVPGVPVHTLRGARRAGRSPSTRTSGGRGDSRPHLSALILMPIGFNSENPEQNDAFRTRLAGEGRIFGDFGVLRQMRLDQQAEIMAQGAHLRRVHSRKRSARRARLRQLEYDGNTIFWKIDCYDPRP